MRQIQSGLCKKYAKLHWILKNWNCSKSREKNAESLLKLSSKVKINQQKVTH